jgi:hypothetical protein
MDVLQTAGADTKKSFLSHVFSTTEEGKAELLNNVQYAIMGVIPIVILNKSIQRFIPEADPENSSLELLAEIIIQLVIMFCGIVVVHRIITYIPTYSGFKYENLALTNVILAFLVLILSIQTKLGLKVNILVDRVVELWEGPSSDAKRGKVNKKNVRFSQQPLSTSHVISQADYLDNSSVQSNMFPPAPVATTKQNSVMETYDNMMGSGASSGRSPQMSGYGGMMPSGPMAANSVLGGSFGSAF